MFEYTGIAVDLRFSSKHLLYVAIRLHAVIHLLLGYERDA